MCGIVGFNWENQNLIKRMALAIKSRGPDDEGILVHNNLSLGQRRLSVMDITKAGHMPILYHQDLGAFSAKHSRINFEDFVAGKLKNVVGIVFNGEIYNFGELKEELIKDGYKFTTKTDTEVILASYVKYGYDCVQRFNGMWAFCIIDFDKNILFCSRDRLGKKPFYYYSKDGQFMFASELKAILEFKDLRINSFKNLNKQAIDFYFSLGYIPSPHTVYNHVFKLEPRQNLVFDLNKKSLKKWYYYEIPDYDPIHDEKKLIEEGRKILTDAVKMRMIADVPVGAFLSGGLDSTTIVGVMKDFTNLKNLNTFSIGFDGEFDETKYINIAKDYFKTNHHPLYFKEDDFRTLIDKYADIYDEPLADFSCFPTIKLSEITKKEVTVSLSGDGGDEIFGGYNTHLLGARMNLLKRIPAPLRKIGTKLKTAKNLNNFASIFLLTEAFKTSLQPTENIYSDSLLEFTYRPEIYKKWTIEKMKYCLEKGNNNLAEALRIYDLLYNTLPDNFLAKVDRASMAYGLEVRCPFLDYRFVEFGQKIPTGWKVDAFRTKKIMRKIIKDIIPKEIVNRGKQGFTPPLEKWILQPRYHDDLLQALGYLKIIDEPWYQFYSQKVLKEDNRMYNIYKIRLFLFGKWYERWIRRDKSD